MPPISEIRRPEIIDAAIAALERTGLPLPSYDTIAAEAGMSRQLVRHYFPDPEQMMIAVCDALAARYRDLLMRGILEAKETERLPMFLDFYFGLLSPAGLAKPADDRVYDSLLSLSAQSMPVRTRLREQYGLLHHTVAHEIQISHPTLDQRACHEIGYLFVAMMYGHWKMVASLGMDDGMSRVAREAMDRLIESYVGRYAHPDDMIAPPED